MTELEEDVRLAACIEPRLALLAGGDRFEDFYDKIGVSIETFTTQLAGGSLFNYVDAFRSAGVRSVLFLASAKVSGALRFIHEPTGTPVWILPNPRMHRVLRTAQQRFSPRSSAVSSSASYASTPVRALQRALGSGTVLCPEYEPLDSTSA